MARKVLIVEDDADIREQFSEILNSQGYEVVSAADGAEGMQALKSHKPSLVLLDLMMPRMHGWEFLDKQRSDAELSRIPVVVCSAFPNSAGGIPVPVLSKPVDTQMLLQTVRHYCSASES